MRKGKMAMVLLVLVGMFQVICPFVMLESNVYALSNGDWEYLADEDNKTTISKYLEDQTIVSMPASLTNVNGDCTNDGKVDIDDLTILALAYNSSSPLQNYDVRADLNKDNKIDLLDLSILASNYGFEGEVPMILVNGITITSTSETVSNGASIQMNAVITPTNATNKEVSWSIIPGTGNASISSSGLVTGLSTGTVTVKAIAKDESGVQGTKELTVIEAKTLPGNLYIYPNKLAYGDTSNITLRYTTDQQYSDGSIQFILPEAFTVEDTDQINIASGSSVSSIAELGDGAIISDDGHKVSIFNVIFNDFKEITLTLRDKVIPSVGSYIFSVIGDQDGAGSAYAPTLGIASETNAITVEEGNFVKGIISLPDGMMAPPGGLSVNIVANGANYDSTTVIIPEGQNSVDYSIKLVKGSYIICYYISNTQFIPQGYYSATGTVSNISTATFVDIVSTDINNVDMKLISGYNISGTLSLPLGQVAPTGGVSVSVDARSRTSSGSSYYTFTMIPEGQNSIDYSIRVDKGTYNIRYYTSNGSYVREGYYSTSGTVSNVGSATPINITSTDIENIDLKLRTTNSTVAGDLYAYPNKVVSGSKKDIYLDYRIGQDYSNGSVEFTLPDGFTVEGTDEIRISSGSFISSIADLGSRAVIKDNGHKMSLYNIFAEIARDVVLVLRGKIVPPIGDYTFSVKGDSDGSNNAYTPTLGIGYETKSISALSGNVISGTISLPQGQIAPVGGLKVDVSTSESWFSGASSYQERTTITIPEGQSSASYTLRLIPGKYKINYNTISSSYVSKGYYSTSGTVTSEYSATAIDIVSSDINNINMTLITTASTIAGNLNISPIKAVSGSVRNVYLEYRTGQEYKDGSVEFVLPEGFLVDSTDEIRMSSGSFISSIADLGDRAVISDNGHKLSVFKLMLNDITDIVLNLRNKVIPGIGNYIFSVVGDNDGTNSTYTPTPGSGSETKAISVEEGYVISGTVSLPNGKVAPAGGLNVNLRFSGANTDNKSVMILAGQNSANYSIKLVKGIYRIDYYTSDASYLSRGWYSTTGTVSDFWSSSPVDLVSTAINNINLVLIATDNTIAGQLYVYPNKVVAGSKKDIYIEYQTGQEYKDGSIEFILPEGFSVDGEDEIRMSSGSFISSVANLGGRAVINDNGHKISIYNIFVGITRDIVLVLKEKVIPSIGNYVFAAIGDKDGVNSMYKPTLGNGNEIKTLIAIEGNAIRGTISLPNGMTAPTGGLIVNISTSESWFSGASSYRESTSVTIPEGQNSASYSLKLIPGKYKIKYSVSSTAFVSQGYYSSFGTVANELSATPIEVISTDLNNINMSLITK